MTLLGVGMDICFEHAVVERIVTVNVKFAVYAKGKKNVFEVWPALS